MDLPLEPRISGWLAKLEVIPRNATRGRDFLCGMNHQNRGHSERSVAVGEGGGDTESKNPVRCQEIFGQDWTSLRHSTGFFTPRLVPRRSVQNDRDLGRFIGSKRREGEGGAARSRRIPWNARRMASRLVCCHGMLRLRSVPAFARDGTPLSMTSILNAKLRCRLCPAN